MPACTRPQSTIRRCTVLTASSASLQQLLVLPRPSTDSSEKLFSEGVGLRRLPGWWPGFQQVLRTCSSHVDIHPGALAQIRPLGNQAMISKRCFAPIELPSSDNVGQLFAVVLHRDVHPFLVGQINDFLVCPWAISGEREVFWAQTHSPAGEPRAVWKFFRLRRLSSSSCTLLCLWSR